MIPLPPAFHLKWSWWCTSQSHSKEVSQILMHLATYMYTERGTALAESKLFIFILWKPCMGGGEWMLAENFRNSLFQSFSFFFCKNPRWWLSKIHGRWENNKYARVCKDQIIVHFLFLCRSCSNSTSMSLRYGKLPVHVWSLLHVLEQVADAVLLFHDW